MALCLFCDAELDGSTKPEHILLNGLGGRKTTRNAICSTCNNRFGGTIDNALTSQVMTLRNLLQLESGTGSPAPTLKNVRAGSHTVNIKGDGKMELVAKPFIATALGDGRWNIQIQVGTEDELRRIIPHIAAKTKIPEDKLVEQLVAAQASMVSQRPGVIGHALSFGGPLAIRSMVKSSLVLWSVLVGNDELRGPPYEFARRFVVDGDESFNLSNTHLDSRYFADAEKMKLGYGPLFNLIYVRSDANGRVVAHYTLYNAVAWQLTLAEAGGTPNLKTALISNPLDPSQWSDDAAQMFDIPFEWINSPDYSDELVRSKARLEALIKHYFETKKDVALDSIIESCFETLGLPRDEPVPLERYEELFKLVSYRAGHHLLGLRYAEPISKSRMAELLRRK